MSYFLADQLIACFASIEKQSKHLSYGTAGFRDNINLPLNSVFLRMGVLAALRSTSVGGQAIGVMITASHNPECDNGIKVVDYSGGMMSQDWEPYTESLVNLNDPNYVVAAILAAIPLESRGNPVVIIGRDTRPSSEELFECVKRGAEAAGALVFDIGEVATPQLHFVVQYIYRNYTSVPITQAVVNIALGSYFDVLSSGYRRLLAASRIYRGSLRLPVRSQLVVDCSFGVGSISLATMFTQLSQLESHEGGNLALIPSLDIRNQSRCGKVNEGCGAELVQKSVKPPLNVDPVTDANKLLCSFDGDADRIVFHSFLSNDSMSSPRWILIDGDKISSLVAKLLFQEIQFAELSESFSIGVVQTAYANGASTDYIKDQSIPVVMAKTGVKYMHHKAEKFDVGIYFEANGHGTVIFSDKFLTNVEQAMKTRIPALLAGSCPTTESITSFLATRADCALFRVHACCLAINQAVGDALSDMLVALAAMETLGIDIEQWNDMYTDLPSKMIKLPVPNKNCIICNEDETRTLAPDGLQSALDLAMTTVSRGRCFVRPSGTEDVVRVYAEAQDMAGVECLIAAAVEAIKTYAR